MRLGLEHATQEGRDVLGGRRRASASPPMIAPRARQSRAYRPAVAVMSSPVPRRVTVKRSRSTAMSQPRPVTSARSKRGARYASKSR
jgi:hypothetical protein